MFGLWFCCKFDVERERIEVKMGRRGSVHAWPWSAYPVEARLGERRVEGAAHAPCNSVWPVLFRPDRGLVETPWLAKALARVDPPLVGVLLFPFKNTRWGG